MKNKAKKLCRSENNKMIAGVCGGIAEYFDVDPVIVRLIAVALVFVNGIGLLAYLIGWIVIPLKSGESVIRSKRLYRSSSDKMVGGVCGGVAKYFDIDSTVIRLLAVLSVLTGIGLIAYLIAWVVVPLKGEGRKIMLKENEVIKKKDFGGFALLFGGMLVAIGFVALYDIDFGLPYVSLVFGVYLIYRSLGWK